MSVPPSAVGAGLDGAGLEGANVGGLVGGGEAAVAHAARSIPTMTTAVATMKRWRMAGERYGTARIRVGLRSGLTTPRRFRGAA